MVLKTATAGFKTLLLNPAPALSRRDSALNFWLGVLATICPPASANKTFGLTGVSGVNAYGVTCTVLTVTSATVPASSPPSASLGTKMDIFRVI